MTENFKDENSFAKAIHAVAYHLGDLCEDLKDEKEHTSFKDCKNSLMEKCANSGFLFVRCSSSLKKAEAMGMLKGRLARIEWAKKPGKICFDVSFTD